MKQRESYKNQTIELSSVVKNNSIVCAVSAVSGNGDIESIKDKR